MFSPTSCICRQGSPLRGLASSQTREPLFFPSPPAPTPKPPVSGQTEKRAGAQYLLVRAESEAPGFLI